MDQGCNSSAALEAGAGGGSPAELVLSFADNEI